MASIHADLKNEKKTNSTAQRVNKEQREELRKNAERIILDREKKERKERIAELEEIYGFSILP